jgi:translation initiation factor IF-2
MTDEKKPGTSTLHLSTGTLRSRPDAGGGFSRGGGILSRGVPSPAVTVQIKRKRPTIGIPQEKPDLAPKVEENLSTETLSPARKPVSVPPAKTGSTLSEEERRTRQQALSQSPVFEAPADTDLRTLRVVKHTREEEIPASSETTVPVEAAPEAPEVKKEMVPAAARPKPGLFSSEPLVTLRRVVRPLEKAGLTKDERAAFDRKAAGGAAPAATPTATAVRRPGEVVAKPGEWPDKVVERKSKKEDDEAAAASAKTGLNARRQRKMTITSALKEALVEEETKTAPIVGLKKRRKITRGPQPTIEKLKRTVVIPETIAVQDLANRMSERAVDVIKILMKMGMMVTAGQTIDAETAELVVGELGHTALRVSEDDVEQNLTTEIGEALPRAPVVTIMGHVDHGKTSLLDALRQTDVVSGEAGGITQHIGAYKVVLSSGKSIVFLDTPGHEAFTAMRARGAHVTDVVVLVVAADDSVMPQTIEAISHAKAAGVPIIVAINKVDKPEARPDKVRTELLSHGIVVEDLGGDVLSIEVSAKKKTGLTALEEAILLQAEIMDLRARPTGAAEGTVLEARMDQGLGPVASVLVQQGTLSVGDIFVSGTRWGRVRALIDSRGVRVREAGPATPVEVLGSQGVPEAGDDFVIVADEAKAREVAEYRERKRKTKVVQAGETSVSDIFAKYQSDATMRTLSLIIRGDVQGSVEAIKGSLEKIISDEMKVNVITTGVGAISESDVTLAKSTGALIIGFNVRANPSARDLAKKEGVDIRYYSIIYDVVDAMREAASSLLSPEQKETFLGYAEIRQVFDVSKVGKVAGCMVTEGTIKRGCGVRLLRDNVVIHQGSLKTLKRHKDEVKEVKGGYECGMAFENYQDIRPGDQIECFEIHEVKKVLA